MSRHQTHHPSELAGFIKTQLLPDLTAGLVTGVISVFTSISLAAMVFSGSLNRYIAIGIGMMLFSNIVIRTVVTLTSSFPGVISSPQPEQMAILALVAAAISRNMSTAPPEALLATVVVAIALTSLLTGAFLMALGPLKISELVRYVPYPIVGGFLAGIGWLLVAGAMSFMVGESLSLSSLLTLFQPTVLIRWLPGLLFAALLLIVSRRYSHYLVIPTLIVTAIAVFYGVLLFVIDVPVSEAISRGWLLGPLPQGELWKPITLSTLAQTNWFVIFGQLGSIATVLILSALSLLLNAIGLEVSTEKAIDLNRELRATGIANLLSGLLGGTVGSHSLRSSILAYRMSGRSRFVGLAAAAVFVIVLIFGSTFLTYFPRAVMGGVLMYLGLALLVEWAYDAGFKLPKIEYFTVLLILVAIGAVGFLEGIAVGLVAAVFMFVIKYSRVDATRRVFSGLTYQSNVDRPSEQQKVLLEKAEQIYILELQGFIFFGSANSLLNLVRERMDDSAKQRLQFLVLDFRLVSGVDSSAVLSFGKIKQITAQHQVKLVCTAVPSEVLKLLERGGGFDSPEQATHLFPDLDRGIEWCENQILLEWQPLQSTPSITLQLENLLGNAKQAAIVRPYLEKREIAKGEFVFQQGDAADGIYFLSSGQVSVEVKPPEGPAKRLRAFSSGAIIGEMGVYRKSLRSASVIADQQTCLYRLSNAALERLEREAPEVATALHKLTIHSLSDHLYYGEQESLIIRPRVLRGRDKSVSEDVASDNQKLNQETDAKRSLPQKLESSDVRQAIPLNDRSSTPVAISSEFKNYCREELIYSIGPLADLLIETAIAQNPSLSPWQLIDILANQIPNPKKALEFRQRMVASLNPER